MQKALQSCVLMPHMDFAAFGTSYFISLLFLALATTSVPNMGEVLATECRAHWA